MGAEPDFSGWATKNDLKCSDGRTIRGGAFKHQDKTEVPLVWAHQHNSHDNILGHALLEDRAFGVYTYGYFNDTEQGKNAKKLVKHGDIKALSIYANNLSETQRKDVVHGDIKEVSLVLAGANPGALIDNVSLAHGDEFSDILDEAIIYTGLELEHENPEGEIVGQKTDDKVAETEEVLEHAASATSDKTAEEIFNGLDEDEKNLVYYMVGEALASGDGGSVQHGEDLDEDTETISSEEFLAHIDSKIKEGLTEMTHNLFEQNGQGVAVADKPVLSHSQLSEILSGAKSPGETLKTSFISHAATYGIEDIDILFPDAKALTNSPEVIGRRTEWVADVINGTKHSPFSRIKSTAVDLTADEARAKGYVKGNMKKDEVIKLLKRVTTPTTIYKKQKLDRDDIVDITDLDVVAWLKAEMRLMLDEELARAILIGDGREPDNEDKIDEDHLRPIAYDADMYAHKVTVQSNIGAAGIVESIIRARSFYKGTGTPTFYTTDSILTDLILLTDKVGRRLYETEATLAAALRVAKIVTVEVMEDAPELLGIVVNLSDYTLGADKGGEVNFFDDFDIDYNQQKYLIETRVSGALTKPKSAVVISRAAGTVVTPTSPSFNGSTNTITFPSTPGVVYKVDGVIKTGTLVITDTVEVEASPATGYAFPHNTNTVWTFVYTP